MVVFDYSTILTNIYDNVIKNYNLLIQGYVENKYNFVSDLYTILLMKIQNEEFDDGIYLVVPEEYIDVFNYLYPRISAAGNNIIKNNITDDINKLYYNYNLFIVGCLLKSIDVRKSIAIINIVKNNLKL